MNNYDKMNSVQSSIETLSKSVQGDGGEGAAGEETLQPSGEAAADAGIQEPASDGADALPAGTAEGAEPVVQEGDGGEEY